MTEFLSGGVLWSMLQGVIGFFSGASRERKKRRKEFRGALVEFKFRIDKCGQFHVGADEWKEKQPGFVRQADEVRDAVRRRKRVAFDEAILKLRNMSRGKLDNGYVMREAKSF
jgi:hypothetical protein